MSYAVQIRDGAEIACDTIAQALRVVAEEMDKNTSPESSTLQIVRVRGESVYGRWRSVGTPMPGLYWVYEHKLWRQVVL